MGIMAISVILCLEYHAVLFATKVCSEKILLYRQKEREDSFCESSLFVFYNYFLASFLARLLFQITHNGPAINSDEIPPEIRPNAIGIAKVRRLCKPKSSDTTTIVITARNVVTEVITLRLKVWLILRLTTSPISLSGSRRLFSRTRS